jgi:predicted amidophosphoribosyltransferase
VDEKLEETITLCPACDSIVRFIYRYCPKCENQIMSRRSK